MIQTADSGRPAAIYSAQLSGLDYPFGHGQAIQAILIPLRQIRGSARDYLPDFAWFGARL